MLKNYNCGIFRYNTNDENSPCYLLNTKLRTFEEAEAYCATFGGHLASALSEGLSQHDHHPPPPPPWLPPLHPPPHHHRHHDFQMRITSSAVSSWGKGCRCGGLGLNVATRIVRRMAGFDDGGCDGIRYSLNLKHLNKFSWSWTDGNDWSYENWKAGDGIIVFYGFEWWSDLVGVGLIE